MSRLWVGIIAFAGGIGAGLFIAKLYAQNTVSTDIHSVLSPVGLGGGTVEKVADQLIVPNV